ncbi:PRC-barrel domain-containing protein [Tautonia sociabilis]|uniref:PRC-barrel domain containing protein n=1 Tax=Tautonia sociabilis TaxID=2080755 RepID=A0A432MPW5_9BACT|nr:PRC-barrel domain-containing protein [Tautonia sociabilis]RUL89380.1 PRC-barrel domain containing protein [Tautonia sociabilis]
MIAFWNRLGIPVMIGGLALSGGVNAQEGEGQPALTTRTDAIADAETAIAPVRRVSELFKGEVRGPGDEEKIASIKDLILDGQGAPHYVLITRGGVAGLGGETIAVPFEVARLTYVEDGGWRLTLEMTGEQLAQAPTLEEGSLAPLRDRSWLQANRQFFGANPAGNDSGTGDESFLFRASALKDAQVRGAGGDESIANVDDLLLDDDFRATFAILGFGGIAGLGKEQVPVPFDRLRLDSEEDGGRSVLIVRSDTTKERLQSETAPRLDGEYNRMLDPTFVERVREYFGAIDPGAAGLERRP